MSTPWQSRSERWHAKRQSSARRESLERKMQRQTIPQRAAEGIEWGGIEIQLRRWRKEFQPSSMRLRKKRKQVDYVTLWCS